MAKCTNKSYLMYQPTGSSSFEKLVDITEYPDLGGDKEKLDSTTLSDTRTRNINGIEDASDLTFSAWYEADDYAKLLEIEDADTVNTYQVWFNDDGADGIWEWEGKMHVYPASGAVNAVREMQFSITDEGEQALHYVGTSPTSVKPTSASASSTSAKAS